MTPSLEVITGTPHAPYLYRVHGPDVVEYTADFAYQLSTDTIWARIRRGAEHVDSIDTETRPTAFSADQALRIAQDLFAELQEELP